MSRSHSNPKRNESSKTPAKADPKRGAAAKPGRQSGNGPGQVGRRPSRPGVLGLIGIMWIVVGVVELFVLDASWRFVPAIVCVGIGLFFLRGAFVSVLRQDEHRQQ